MRGRLAASLVLAGLAISCAKVAPPPGGPEDRDPPQISDAAPPRNATGVPADSAFVLTFSERIDQRSVMRGLTIYPPVDFRESSWEAGTRLRLVPDEGWPGDRPVLVLLAATAKDRRGNELGTAFRTRFWTADVRDSGEVAGKVWSGREVPRGTTPLVAAYRAGAPGDTLDPLRAYPVAVDDAEKSGEFRLTGLDPAHRYHIVAMIDPSGDARPDGRGEFWQEAPATVDLAGAASADSADTSVVRVPEFLLGTLDSLGAIQGEVEADSGTAAFVWAESDTVRDFMSVPGGGPFRLELPTGRTYRLLAFVDADGDSLPGVPESIVVHEEPVPLLMTADQSGFRFNLTGLGPAPPDSASGSAEDNAEERPAAPTPDDDGAEPGSP
ncbi:MAG: Ig-like domain-containing protein [Gemmatimonadetes bacterium]|nr:Ig-like domain-containing protein [Gemmatimonadota bacterium]